MSDDTPETGKHGQGPVGGEKLRAARRQNDISIGEIAKELHIDEPKVRSLERNEYDLLGAPVFAKGYLRKYAALVGVPIDDIMSDYYEMTRSAVIPPVVGPRRPVERQINLVPWLSGGMLVLLVAAVGYWWFAVRPEQLTSVAAPAGLAPFTRDAVQEAPPTAPVAMPSGNDEAQPAEAAGDAGAPPVEESAATAQPAVVTDDEAYVPTPGATQVELQLAFTGDCWTEVSDASGRRLYYALGHEGQVVHLSGDAPLRVILGNAQNVEIEVDGEPRPIPASARRGRLARLNIASR